MVFENAKAKLCLLQYVLMLKKLRIWAFFKVIKTRELEFSL
jgi:hypothetical protein